MVPKQEQIFSQDEPTRELTPEFDDEQESSLDYKAEGSTEEEDKGKIPVSRGIWIATATFVPTFLAIFFGSPYLGSLAPNPPRVTIESDSRSVVSPARDVNLPDRLKAMAAMTPSESATVPTRLPSDKPAGFPPVVPSKGPTAAGGPEVGTPYPPPLPPRTQGRLRTEEPEGSASIRSDAPRSGSVSTKGGSWAPTAAFADRASAERLAASIKRQAYPVAVEVRRDDSTTGMPWVVWVASQPKRSPSEPVLGSRRSGLGQPP